MRITLCRSFEVWKPGRCYTPLPRKQLDVQKEYTDRLYAAVDENMPLLAKHLKTKPKPKDVVHSLLNQSSKELQAVKSTRLSATKREDSPAEDYAHFLRCLYAPTLAPRSLEIALRRLPGAKHSLQAQYIQGTHLETLINRSMPFPSLFRFVCLLVERAGLPLTSRELSTEIFAIARDKGNWKDALAQRWPRILAARDTGALNQLLKVALMFHCRETQSLVQYHLNMHPNRYTYLLKLRYEANASPTEILREFRKRHFVVDTITISSYISGLLRSGWTQGSIAAEEAFNGMAADNEGVFPIVCNANKAANLLSALDSVAQITQKQYEVPLYVDSHLYERMYTHYVSLQRHAEAIDLLKSMAASGQSLPRKLIVAHILGLNSRVDLERLFYLCCDYNMVEPGFINDKMASIWSTAISESTDMTYEDACSLVDRNRAVMPPAVI